MTEAEIPPVKILLVDDHAANLLALEAVLEPLGQDLVVARSGREAIAKLQAEEFALVLMDVQMPVLDGFETVEVIRRKEDLRHLPVMFVTALFRDKESAALGYSLGAVDFIIKPFDPDVIRAKVGAFVALHQRNEKIKLQERRLAEETALRMMAEQASRTREEFVAILGHDLRAPLNVIHLSAERWVELPDVPDACRDAARRILKSAARMEQLVHDCLDLTRSRMGAGIPVDPEPADMAALVRVPVEELRTIHGGREIRLDVDGDVRGRWDPGRVTQVAANLLDNALKYSSSREPVSLALRGEPDTVLMTVHNLGPPIPNGTDLFQPFKRGRPRHQGLGLGLYIVDQIVKAHGGSIDVESANETGTRFIVRWPRALEAIAAT